MLVAAAVCPHPPLLIPAAAGAVGRAVGGAPGDTGASAAAHGTAGEAVGPGGVGGAAGEPLDDDAILEWLRAACHTAVAELFRADPDLVVVVGGARATGEYSSLAAGSLAEFGVPVTIGSGPPVLPLSLTIGAWLLRSCGLRVGASETSAACEPPWTAQAPQALPPLAQLPQPAASPAQLPQPVASAAQPPRAVALPAQPPLAVASSAQRLRSAAAPALRLLAVAQDMPAPDCLRLGARLAAAAPRVALLVMGDGSARKATGVPGAPDPAADQYDTEVAAALAAADPDRLARLDAELDEVLLVAGRAAWQVLAGAAAGGQLRGTLRCAVAPFGVSYLVASWDWSPGPLED